MCAASTPQLSVKTMSYTEDVDRLVTAAEKAAQEIDNLCAENSRLKQEVRGNGAEYPSLDIHSVAEVFRENKRLRAENSRLQREAEKALIDRDKYKAQLERLA